jgi:lysine 2,3-aminomutase
MEHNMLTGTNQMTLNGKKRKQVGEWEELLMQSITGIEDLPLEFSGNREGIAKVIKKYPMRINPYYFSLIEKEGDPIWRQCIPDERELMDPFGIDDPLHEEEDSPVPGLTHRYPDRVLLLVSNKCAMYCRFCTRKRKVGVPLRHITMEQVMKGIEYIRNHPEVRDVILSGGDPLLLKDSVIECILKELRKIKHVEIIRIGTRVPCTLPQRITPELCDILRRYHPLYMSLHFNHPREITADAGEACGMLADAGIPLGCQTVMLKGVNDNPEVIKELMQKLLRIRVKPYYIYQCDLTKGVNHFRTRVSKGLEVVEALRGHTSGLAVPHFIIDAPGGGGKIPLLPEYLIRKEGNVYILRNYMGLEYEYPEPAEYEALEAESNVRIVRKIMD